MDFGGFFRFPKKAIMDAKILDSAAYCNWNIPNIIILCDLCYGSEYEQIIPQLLIFYDNSTILNIQDNSSKSQHPEIWNLRETSILIYHYLAMYKIQWLDFIIFLI